MIIPRWKFLCTGSLAMMSSRSSLSPSPSLPAASDYEIVHYPIPGNDSGGHLHLFLGGSDNPSVDDDDDNHDDADTSSPCQLVLMMGGFPDDQSVFHPMARRLADLPEISAVGVICMPGFDTTGRPSSSSLNRPSSSSSPSRDHRPRGGYSFDDCATTVKNAASALRSVPEVAKLDAKTMTLTGVFHDWGVVAGLVWANRALKEKEDSATPPPDRLVLFDVSAGLHPATTRTARQSRPYSAVISSLPATILRGAVNWLYRIQLAVAFILQRWVSRRASDIYMKLPTVKRLNPLRDVDQPYISDEIRMYEWEAGRLGYISYPYWKILTDGLSGRFFSTWGRHWHLPRDLDKTPVLLMTGEDKNACFHDEDAADFLKYCCSSTSLPPSEKKNGGVREGSGSGSNWISVPNAGHWLFRQQPNICFNAVRDFILSDSKQTK